MKFIKLNLLAFVLISFSAVAGEPQCYGPDNWAANMAFVKLKNAGITDNDKIDFSKTQPVKLASEIIGKDEHYNDDLYRQVQNIKFYEKSGNIIEVITVSNATETECSMSDVDLYIISKHIKSSESGVSSQKENQ